MRNKYLYWDIEDLKEEKHMLKEEISDLLNELNLIDAAIEYKECVNEQPHCTSCAGTGEGQYDGSSCYSCGGSGVPKVERNNDDY